MAVFFLNSSVFTHRKNIGASLKRQKTKKASKVTLRVTKNTGQASDSLFKKINSNIYVFRGNSGYYHVLS